VAPITYTTRGRDFITGFNFLHPNFESYEYQDTLVLNYISCSIKGLNRRKEI